MPANPKSLDDLLNIPDMYEKTLLGEQFLMYDSRTDGREQSSSEEVENVSAAEDCQLQAQRVIVFATRKNIIWVQELALDKKIRYAPTKKWTDLQMRLENITAEYATHPILEYLSKLQNNVNIA